MVYMHVVVAQMGLVLVVMAAGSDRQGEDPASVLVRRSLARGGVPAEHVHVLF